MIFEVQGIITVDTPSSELRLPASISPSNTARGLSFDCKKIGSFRRFQSFASMRFRSWRANLAAELRDRLNRLGHRGFIVDTLLLN